MCVSSPEALPFVGSSPKEKFALSLCVEEDTGWSWIHVCDVDVWVSSFRKVSFSKCTHLLASSVWGI